MFQNLWQALLLRSVEENGGKIGCEFKRLSLKHPSTAVEQLTKTKHPIPQVMGMRTTMGKMLKLYKTAFEWPHLLNLWQVIWHQQVMCFIIFASRTRRSHTTLLRVCLMWHESPFMNLGINVRYIGKCQRQWCSKEMNRLHIGLKILKVIIACRSPNFFWYGCNEFHF